MEARTCENKFWRSPDLVLQLLPFLDVPATLALASAHPLACDLLARISTWRKFLERTRVSQERLVACNSVEEYCDEMLDMGEDLDNLDSLLLLLDPESLRPELDLEVLQTICRRFPASKKRAASRDFTLVNNTIKLRLHNVRESTGNSGRQQVFFSVSSEGLELIRILNSFEHFEVVSVQMDDMLQFDFANTICEIVELQQKPLRRLEANQVNLERKSLALLVDHCQTWQVQVLSISEHFSAEDWS